MYDITHYLNPEPNATKYVPSTAAKEAKSPGAEATRGERGWRARDSRKNWTGEPVALHQPVRERNCSSPGLEADIYSYRQRWREIRFPREFAHRFFFCVHEPLAIRRENSEVTWLALIFVSALTITRSSKVSVVKPAICSFPAELLVQISRGFRRVATTTPHVHTCHQSRLAPYAVQVFPYAPL